MTVPTHSGAPCDDPRADPTDSARPPAARLALHHVLFTDIEGSSERWDRQPDLMRELVRDHDELLDATVDAHGGSVLKRTGDGLVATFRTPGEAVACAVAIQRAFAAWSPERRLAVRIGVHRGMLEARHGDLHGPAMNRAARVMDCAHGGQVVVTDAIRQAGGWATGAPDVDLVSLGHHRLRGLLEAEHVHQVVAPGLRTGFPPLRSLNATLGWLPAATDTFIGRDAELAELTAALRDHRLVTVVGAGGIGKTCLAVHVANRLRGAYPDGAWFVDLAAIEDDDRVVPAIAAALGMGRDPSGDLLGQVRERCASSRMLVVLDNCEHVHAGVVTAVTALHQTGGATTWLCTSQRSLRVPTERVLRVGPLATDRTVAATDSTSGADRGATNGATAAGGAATDAVVLTPAAELFVARARLADPTLELTPADHAAVAAVCRELEGVPLAIELAAARCEVLTPDEILQRLNDRFALLRRRDGTHRHLTLWNAIGWSYDLLDEPTQRLLRAVSVFADPFTASDAALIAAPPSDARPASGAGPETDTLGLLGELVECSLLERSPAGFRLLDSVRRFAAEQRSAAGDDLDVRGRYADWLDALAAAPIDDLDVDRAADNLDRVAARLNDIRGALATVAEIDPSRAARAVIALTPLWVGRDLDHDALEWLERVADEVAPVALRVEVLSWMSGFGWAGGRNEDAERWAVAAIDLAAEEGLPYPALAGSRLAVQLVFRGAAAEAVEVAERSLAALTGDQNGSRLLGALAVVFGAAGDLDRAIRLADDGVAAARRIGASRLNGALMNRMLISHGRPEALPFATEVAALSERLGRVSGRAHALWALAELAATNGDVDTFLTHAIGAVDGMLRTNQRTAAANMLNGVPAVIATAEPAGTAVLLGALATVHEEVGFSGLAATVETFDTLRSALRSRLGAAEFEQLAATGRGASMEAVLDSLRWLAERRAEALR